METNFTKGPWKLYGDWGVQPASAIGDEKIFAQFSCDAECNSPREGFANAHLIRAAPEMFEVLRLTRKCVGHQLIDLDRDGNTMVSIREIIDAVMESATGK